MVVAITGGIGTGKSTAVRYLVEALGEGNCHVFDCDSEAHKLLTTPEIIARVAEEFGNEVLNPDGSVNRSTLRTLVFNDDERRLKLEGLIHPKILDSASDELLQFAAQFEDPFYFILEIPLLYEVGFQIDRNWDILIAATQNTQIRRLSEQRNLEKQTIDALLASQLPIGTKIKSADFVVWNEGSNEELKLEIELLSQTLKLTNLKTS